MCFRHGKRAICAALGFSFSAFTLAGTAQAQDDPTLSFWGGYFFTHAADVEGYSIGNGTNPPVIDVFRPQPKEGGFAGMSFGRALDSNSFFFDHVEAYVQGHWTSRDSSSAVGVGTFPTIPMVNGNLAAASTAEVSAKMTRERYEFGAEFSLTGATLPELPFDWGVTPFGGVAYENSARALFLGGPYVKTSADIDWHFAGLMLGGKKALPIGSGFEFVFGAAGGVYVYDAKGDFNTVSTAPAFPANSARDSDSDVGFRGKAKLELRAVVSERVQVSLFGEVDYWSDVPHAKLPDPTGFNGQPPAHISKDDMLDVNAGVKVSFALYTP